MMDARVTSGTSSFDLTREFLMALALFAPLLLVSRLFPFRWLKIAIFGITTLGRTAFLAFAIKRRPSYFAAPVLLFALATFLAYPKTHFIPNDPVKTAAALRDLLIAATLLYLRIRMSEEGGSFYSFIKRYLITLAAVAVYVPLATLAIAGLKYLGVKSVVEAVSRYQAQSMHGLSSFIHLLPRIAGYILVLSLLLEFMYSLSVWVFRAAVNKGKVESEEELPAEATIFPVRPAWNFLFLFLMGGIV